MSRSLRTEPYERRAARRVRGRVEIRASPARRGFVHPAGVGDIRRVLEFFGPGAVYGLRRVELRQRVRDGLLVAGLQVPGTVVLVEQPAPPWVVAGRLTDEALRRLQRAGAEVQVFAAHTRVDWPGETLRDFVLFDGLMHEIGHHRLHKDARALRTADHERLADAYAAACRAAW